MLARRSVMARAATMIAAVAALTLGACGDPADDDSAAQTASSAPAADAPSASSTPASLPESLQFTVKTVDGQPFDNAALAGKPTVFWFWASWCPVCRDKADSVAALHRDNPGKINVIGVAGLKSGDDAMRKFVVDEGIGDFPNLSDDAGEIWRKYAVKMQDDYVIIDRTGKIVHNGPLPDADLRKRVAELAA